MEDLFKAAGIDPTNVGSDPSGALPRGGEKRRLERGQEREEPTFGGHNLRRVIRARDGDGEQVVVQRPTSTFTSATPAQFMESAAVRELDPQSDVADDPYYDEDEEDGDEYDMEDSDDDEGTATTRRTGNVTGPTVVPRAPAQGQLAHPPPVPAPTVSHPIPLTTVKPESKLGQAAVDVFSTAGFNLQRELGWQAAVGADTAKMKAFRLEVTQQVDVTPFGFMRPSSPFIQVVHSIATYAVRGGQSDLHNVDFGFVGDRTGLRIPTPVILDDKMWKWVSKKLGLDVPPLEQYYANPANARLLYHDDAAGGENTTVPRMVYLPPPFLVYCLEDQRTPFQLHQFVAKYATRDGSDVTIKHCELLMDWCFLASHRAAASSPTTSTLAIALAAAPSDDDDFLRWLYKIDCTAQSAQGYNDPSLPPPPHPPATAQSLPTALHAPASGGPPPPDVWAQMAKSISSSFATAAAALKPAPADVSEADYERGGVFYDKFQLAVLQGFAHAPTLAGVPVIWVWFQYSKTMETHKDNLRRKMSEWATSPAREVQVPIERGLYIPDSTMKEILSLNFNPGGILAEADSADLGLSLLICRARTTAAKAAIRKYEKALEQSKKNRSMAEAQAVQVAHVAYDVGALPDNYHELLRCIGTYCAMLHALFGDKCVFYRHCYALWTAMNSDLVYEQRDGFTALYCRQIVWAVLMDSRVYFSRRMSVEDFMNVHPDDISFPKSNLISIVQMVRDMAPIVRSSFPAAWFPSSAPVQASRGTVVSASLPANQPAPVQSVATGGGTTPSVVSGLTAGSARAPRPPATIRASDIHPQIKPAMEAYIAKNKGVYLSAILTHCNLTMEDLPKLTPDISGVNGICYNYILGRCTMDNCQYEHVHARDLTDEFATDLLSKLRPGITEFTMNGLPPGTRRRRRTRRRTNA